MRDHTQNREEGDTAINPRRLVLAPRWDDRQGIPILVDLLTGARWSLKPVVRESVEAEKQPRSSHGEDRARPPSHRRPAA